MNMNYFLNIMYVSNIVFVILLFFEFNLLKFKKKSTKWILLICILIFGYIAFFFFQTFKRKLILRRRFNPKFKRKNINELSIQTL